MKMRIMLKFNIEAADLDEAGEMLARLEPYANELAKEIGATYAGSSAGLRRDRKPKVQKTSLPEIEVVEEVVATGPNTIIAA